jgi:uncharacterized protein (TIGR02246 family)
MATRRAVVVCGLTLAALGAACAQPSSRPETSDVSASPAMSDTAAGRRAIANMNAAFSGLATTRNADSLATWFAADAKVLAIGAPVIHGRDSIRTFYEQFFQAMPIREMTFSTDDVAFSGEVAVETGRSVLSLGGPGQPTPVTVAGKYLSVWKRQPDGRWLLWRHAPSTNVLPR